MNNAEALEKANNLLMSGKLERYARRFPAAFEQASSVTGVYVGESNDDWSKVGLFFQAVWDFLPDNASIRVEPFFDICDLAEHWCFGSDDDEDNEDDR